MYFKISRTRIKIQRSLIILHTNFLIVLLQFSAPEGSRSMVNDSHILLNFTWCKQQALFVYEGDAFVRHFRADVYDAMREIYYGRRIRSNDPTAH
jgi:hypothetical protein